MRQACLDMVYELAKTDQRVFFIGSDLGVGTLDKFKDELLILLNTKISEFIPFSLSSTPSSTENTAKESHPCFSRAFAHSTLPWPYALALTTTIMRFWFK